MATEKRTLGKSARGAGRTDDRITLTVARSGRELRTELRCGDETVWTGPWEVELRRNGQPVRPCRGWDEACWTSEEGNDYLELVGQFGDGYRIERHLLLAQADRLLLLADAIFAPEAAKIDYRSCLPLAPSVQFEAAEENAEGFLLNRRRLGLVLPLAMSEWRSTAKAGAIVGRDGVFEMHQAAQGRAMFCPLLIDLDRRRFRSPRTWRQLTVAENCQAQPADVAVGYRAAIGNRQWLIYRALCSKGNRSVLGHNLSSQFLVARFQPKGAVKALVEIE